MPRAVVFHGDGLVWDPERNRVLCKFVGGKYETEDAREIGILAKTFAHDLPVAAEPDDSIADEPEEAVTGETAKRPRGRPRHV